MNNLGRKTTLIMASLLYGGLLSSVPVLADDTEIYLGSNLGVNDAQPNVLFIVDTSGSMDSDVITRADYDPSHDYGEDDDACRQFTNDRVFTSNSTRCRWDEDDLYFFDADALKCHAAILSLASTGFYQDRLAMWRGGEWDSVSNRSRNRDNDVECAADSGIHGEHLIDADKWASDSNGPWSSNSTDSVTWSSTGRSYTIYSGNYLNYLRTAPITSRKSRIETVKDVVTNVVNSVQNIRIGLMRFDSDANGGMVVTPMGPIDATKPDFLDALDAMEPEGGTPLGEVMIEAALYYQGKNVDYGNRSEDHNGDDLLSHEKSRTPDGGSKYKTPIELQCQKNFIVYLTDGEPTSDSPSSTRLALVGAPTTCAGTAYCLDDIAGAMAAKDQSDDFAEDQKVSTYTIGFATDQVLLSATAAASKKGSGAGKYYTADNTEELTNAFTNILTDILGVSATFSSPAVSVNAFNRTSHRSDLYFSLFKPSTGPHWDGNFKRYKLSFETDGTPIVTDAEDKVAVSDTTGYFRDDSISFWTQAADAPDGAEAEEGGAASRLTNTRKVYTYTGTSLTLSAPTNQLHEDNADVTTTLLGLDTQADPAAYRKKLLQWARGIDVNDSDADGDLTDARRIMGDPLHGQPALIQYAGPDDDPDLTAYVVTNDGYLHAVDTKLDKGTEIFSFVPAELLDRLSVFYEDDGSIQKPYGIDGSVVPWVKDVNEDGVIKLGTDHVYIYFGMRRGGNNYYALDVTDRANPKLKWVIRGGSAGFKELGQTWSKPTLRKIKVAGKDTPVLIFGGGYDTNQDAVADRTEDSIGRAIYIVDADTGILLWSVSNQAGSTRTLADMDYSIPSDIAALDTKGDGYVNMLFVGDMGGQIWRFDIKASDSESNLDNLITGGRIADFSADSTPADTRRFYYPPDAAILKNDKGVAYLSLIAVSGYRSGPLNLVVDDRIYMLRPEMSPPSSYTTLTEDDLFNTTENDIGEGDAGEQDDAALLLASKHGWYIELEENGEKGLSRPLIFAGNVFITTYIPTDSSSAGTTCLPSEGWGRLYIISAANGTPVHNFDTVEVDSDDELTKADRIRTLNKAGIPADPIMIRTNDPNQKNVANCIGTECFEVDDTNRRTSLYWYEK
ncbi:MAG: pilus assembly protein [Gammaproteobacteria bacterium]